MNERLEELALDFDEDAGIVWIAYRSSGDEKAEALYTEGWDTEGAKGPKLLSLIRRILDNEMVPSGGVLFPRFVGCSKVYIHNYMDTPIRSVLEEFFTTIDVNYDIVEPEYTDYEDLNNRWKGPLGEDISEDDYGVLDVLCVLNAGISVGQPVEVTDSP